MKFGSSTSSALLSLLVAASGLLVVAAGNNNNNNNNNNDNYDGAMAGYDGAILVLGDSWASKSGSYLSNVCSLTSSSSSSSSSYYSSSSSSSSSSPLSFSVTNSGISGSTASQWASNGYASKSFNNNKYDYDYDYVWLSIGGNDFNCDASYHESIAENIVSVIADVVSSSSNNNIKILYTGYGYPSANICGNNYGGNNDDGDVDSDGLISIFEDFAETILGAIQSSAYAKYVYAMDVSTLFVTEDSYPLSDSYYYADSIHINEYGYDKLFSLEDVQYFFGCVSKKSGNESSWTSSAYGRSGNGVGIGFGSKSGTVMMGVIFVSLAALGLYAIYKKRNQNIPGLSGTLLSSNNNSNNKQQQAVDVV